MDKDFQDFLHDIESLVVDICYSQRELTDKHIDEVYNALHHFYEAQLEGSVSPSADFEHELQKLLLDAVFNLCEWRLGRRDTNGKKASTPLTRTELLGCIQSLRHWVYLWSGEHSNRGYLDYIHYTL